VTWSRLRIPALLILLGLLVHGPVLGFPGSPEDWVDGIRLREAGWLEVLLPLESYTYYRPLWFLLLKIREAFGIGEAAFHALPLFLHLGGALLVRSILRGLGSGELTAFLGAAFALCAPGTVGALSWLAAGNKACVFFFLALGLRSALLARSPRASFVGALLGFVAALGCAENAYLGILLLPLGLALRGRAGRESPPAGRPSRSLAPALGLFAATLALGILHLGAIPGEGGKGGRLGELLSALGSDPIAWLGRVGGNLERYFLHGIGVAHDGQAGFLFLGLFLAALLAARRWAAGLAWALGIFLLSNFPASFFPGENSKHQAYLPALGAGLVLAALLARLPARMRVVLGLLVLGLWVPRSRAFQAPWGHFLRVSEGLRADLHALARARAGGAPPLLWNLPFDYLPALREVLGPDVEVEKWPRVFVPTTRRGILLPRSLDLAKAGGIEIWEYRGSRVEAVSLKEILARKPAPRAWLLDHLEACPDPVFLVGPMAGSELPLESLPWTLEPERAREAESGTAPAVPGEGPAAVFELREEPGGETGGFVWSWRVRGRCTRPTWLVLAWDPTPLPVTETVRTFDLEALPWLFRLEITGAAGREVRLPVVPVLGVFPAIRLGRGPFDFRARLKLR